MGAKGKKRMACKKAKNRTGMLNRISEPHSTNQRNKQKKIEQEQAYELGQLKKRMGLK